MNDLITFVQIPYIWQGGIMDSFASYFCLKRRVKMWKLKELQNSAIWPKQVGAGQNSLCCGPCGRSSSEHLAITRCNDWDRPEQNGVLQLDICSTLHSKTEHSGWNGMELTTTVIIFCKSMDVYDIISRFSPLLGMGYINILISLVTSDAITQLIWIFIYSGCVVSIMNLKLLCYLNS